MCWSLCSTCWQPMTAKLPWSSWRPSTICYRYIVKNMCLHGVDCSRRVRLVQSKCCLSSGFLPNTWLASQVTSEAYCTAYPLIWVLHALNSYLSKLSVMYHIIHYLQFIRRWWTTAYNFQKENNSKEICFSKYFHILLPADGFLFLGPDEMGI